MTAPSWNGPSYGHRDYTAGEARGHAEGYAFAYETCAETASAQCCDLPAEDGREAGADGPYAGRYVVDWELPY